MIHYHGTPVSGSYDDAARFLRGRHAMVSYAAPEHLEIAAEVCQSFALDNGAFSLWGKGKTLDVDGYCEWVEQWHRHPSFDWCLIPDVIDGSEGDNARLVNEWATSALKDCGVPVWHFHESSDYLARLCGAWPRVALGSSGQWSTPGADAWWDRLASVMPRIIDATGRPWCKLHGLRMLNPAIFTRLPLASADSTNAVRNAGSYSRFGSYLPPTPAGRATVIADRIESHTAAKSWKPEVIQDSLLSLIGCA